MLRTIFVIAIIAFGIRHSLRGPFYALLFYLWIAYFRPEYWLWTDFFTQLKLSLIIGVVVLVGTIFSGKKLAFGFGSTLFLVFLAHSLLSTLLSPYFDFAWHYWQEFARCIIISFLIVTLVDDEKKLRLTLVVIALSLGFEATKQGWAQMILNPGAANTNPNPFLGDNNGTAVGVLMLAALVIALARTAARRYERWLERFAVVGIFYRAISTYSRGGFLACGAMVAQYLVRSKHRIVALAAVVIVGLGITSVLPQEFWDRMSTIEVASQDTDKADASAAGRLHFWRVATDMAKDRPILGVGHNAFMRAYDRYDFTNGKFGVGRAAHSAWFGVLADLGYPGLLLFIAIQIYALRACARVLRLAKRHKELTNLGCYASGIEAALVACAVGGAFVSIQYMEMWWHVLALSVVAGRVAAARTAQIEVTPAPVPAVVATGVNLPRLGVALLGVAPVARPRAAVRI